MKFNTIKSGTIWSILGQIISFIFGFLILILTTRFLGPEYYGLLQTILTLIILSVMIADLGFSSSVSRYVAEYQKSLSERSQYIFTGLTLKLIFSVLVIILLIYILPILENLLEINIKKYSFLLIAITIFRSFREFFLRVLQGIRRFDVSTKLNIFYNIFNTILVAIFLLLGLEIYSVLYAELLTTVIFIMVLFFLNKRLSMFRFKSSPFNKYIIKNLLLYAAPMFFISMSFYLYTKTDILMVQYFLNSVAVGYYTLATMIIGKVHLPLVALGQAAGPALVPLNFNERASKLVQLIKVALVLAFPMSMGIFLISNEFIVIVFGNEYFATIKLLQLMTLFLFFYNINSVLSPILDYLGFARKRAVIVGISATINVFLNVIFIPKYGIFGAAFSTILTYSLYSMTIVSIIFRSIIKEKNYFKKIYLITFKVLVATILMGIIVSFVQFIFKDYLLFNFVSAIVVGVLSYTLLIIKLKIVTVKELIYLKN